MSETTRTLQFGPMDGKTYQLAKLALAFKRSDGEGEGSYSIYEQLEQPGTTVMRRGPWRDHHDPARGVARLRVHLVRARTAVNGQ